MHWLTDGGRCPVGFCQASQALNWLQSQDAHTCMAQHMATGTGAPCSLGWWRLTCQQGLGTPRSRVKGISEDSSGYRLLFRRKIKQYFSPKFLKVVLILKSRWILEPPLNLAKSHWSQLLWQKCWEFYICWAPQWVENIPERLLGSQLLLQFTEIKPSIIWFLYLGMSAILPITYFVASMHWAFCEYQNT